RVAIRRQVLVWKITLPGIGHVTAARRQLVAPGELGSIEATARGIFPLGFGGKLLAGPGSVSFRVLVRDMHHRMIVEALVRTASALGATPVCADITLRALR